jgi:hypothetical protein
MNNRGTKVLLHRSRCGSDFVASLLLIKVHESVPPTSGDTTHREDEIVGYRVVLRESVRNAPDRVFDKMFSPNELDEATRYFRRVETARAETFSANT